MPIIYIMILLLTGTLHSLALEVKEFLIGIRTAELVLVYSVYSFYNTTEVANPNKMMNIERT